jgi:biotin carboxylase
VAYLILDPVGRYPAEMMAFLARAGQPAVGIFTDPRTLAVYEHVYAERLAGQIADVYLLPQHRSVAALAAVLAEDWGDELVGVIPWDEMGVEIGAELSARLDLGWNPPRVIERFRNKYAMKTYLRTHAAVRVNASRLARNAADALAFARALGRWPIVVKPATGAGSTGVFFVHDEAELLARANEVLALGYDEVLLEEYVGGREFVVNGMVDANERFLPTDVWLYDKRSSHGIDNLYFETRKVDAGEEVFWELANYAAAVLEALGVRRAPVHMELKLDEQGPCLIEVGARLAGGNQPLLASRLHGRSLFELAACHYLAELPLRRDDIDYGRYDELQARIVSGVQTHEIRRVRAVHGLDAVRALPSFHDVGFVRPAGVRLAQTRDLSTKSYEIYLVHPDPAQIAHDAREVRRLLRYE